MLLWLKSRRIGVLWWTTCAVLVVFAVFSGSTIPMIDLLEGGLSAIPLMVLLPLIPAGAVLASVGGSDDGLELVAARRVHGYDVMLVVTVSAVVAAVGWGLAAAEIQPYGPAAARPWAWPLGESQTRSAALLAAACGVIGLIALASRRRPRRHGAAENG